MTNMLHKRRRASQSQLFRYSGVPQKPKAIVLNQQNLFKIQGPK